jgi:hypothetical protein
MNNIIIDNKEYIIFDRIMIAFGDITQLNYYDALLYCRLLTNAYDDWRLFTVNDWDEIQQYLYKYHAHEYAWIESSDVDKTAKAIFTGAPAYEYNQQTIMDGYVDTELTVIPVRDRNE